MDFFSGLKKAYDSFGEEITKTFDSSQSGEDTKADTTASHEQGDLPATPINSRTSPELMAGDQSSVYTTPLATNQRQDQNSLDIGGWGQWESQPLMAANAKTHAVCFKW